MGPIIDDVYTMVEDHTEVGGGVYSMRRKESKVRLARGGKKYVNRYYTRPQCRASYANAGPRANRHGVCPYSRKSL